MCVSKQVHSTVPGQYSTCPGTAVGTKQPLCSEQSPGLGRSWQRHGRVVARQVGERGRRMETLHVEGLTRNVLYCCCWSGRSKREKNSTSGSVSGSMAFPGCLSGCWRVYRPLHLHHPHSCEPPIRVHPARVPSAFVARETALAPAWYRQQPGGFPPG